jgi:hypothetical protein
MIKVGDKIKIIHMEGEPQYTNKEGIVTSINKDPWGETQIHGTWGSCCVYLEKDEVQVLV